MGIAFSSVIVQVEGMEIVRILDQQRQALCVVFSCRQGIAQNLWSKATPVYGHDSHPWTNTGSGRIHTFNRVLDAAILSDPEANRRAGVELAVILFPGAHHLRAILVVNQLPPPAFNAPQRRTGGVVG